MKIFQDRFGNQVRLSNERQNHIETRKEMKNQIKRIQETLIDPDSIFHSNHDQEVYLYYKKYRNTPVTEKYLLVVARVSPGNSFILTSFFTDKIKAGVLKWQK